jgi:plasmid stabilization system protein ParE
MGFGYVIRPQADQDLDEIADYSVEAAGLDTGLRFMSETFAAFNLLAIE